MNHSKTLFAGLALFGALFAIPAAAQSTKGTLYLGASMGQAEKKEFCGNAGGSCENKDTAWRAFGGWQFHRHIGVEAGYADLGTATRGPAATADNARFKAYDVQAVISYPFDKLSLFGKVGGYYSKVSSTNAGTGMITEENNGGLAFGGGLQYNVFKNFALRGDWQHYAKVGGGTLGTESEIDSFMLGVVLQLP